MMDVDPLEPHDGLPAPPHFDPIADDSPIDLGDGDVSIDDWRSGVQTELHDLFHDDAGHTDQDLHDQLTHLIAEADSPQDAWDAAVALATEQPDLDLDLDVVADLVWGDDSELIVGHGLDESAATHIPVEETPVTEPTVAETPIVVLPLEPIHITPTPTPAGPGDLLVDHPHGEAPQQGPVTAPGTGATTSGHEQPVDGHSNDPGHEFGGTSRAATSTSSIVPGSDADGPPTTAPTTDNLAPPEGFDTPGHGTMGPDGGHVTAMGTNASAPNDPEVAPPVPIAVLGAAANAVGNAAEAIGDAITGIFDTSDSSDTDQTSSAARTGLVAGTGLAAALGVAAKRQRHADGTDTNSTDETSLHDSTSTNPPPGAQP